MERKKMSNFQIGIIVVAIILGIGLIGVLSDDNTNPQKPENDNNVQVEEQAEEQTTKGEKENEKYPESVKEGFVQECTIRPGMEEYCECALDEIENKYTLAEFYELSMEMENQQEMPQEILEVVGKCSYLIELDK